MESYIQPKLIKKTTSTSEFPDSNLSHWATRTWFDGDSLLKVYGGVYPSSSFEFGGTIWSSERSACVILHVNH